MTNYNERLDELLLTTLREMSRELEAYGYLDSKNYLPEKREAITSLIKELVAEAKPRKKHVGDEVAENRSYTGERLFNAAVYEFEQNLLKGLETREWVKTDY